MRYNRTLSRMGNSIATVAIILIVATPLTLYHFVYSKNLVALRELFYLVDISIKIPAGILGILWVLNRYYTERRDIPRIEFDIEHCNALINGQKVFSFFLEISNQSNALIGNLEYNYTLHALDIIDGEIVQKKIGELAQNSNHIAKDLEPGSWFGLNENVILEENIQLVRIDVNCVVDNRRVWKWHKNLKLDLQ